MTEVYSPDTLAYIQRGVLQQPGFYGSQELSESNQSFNSAVGIAVSLAGYANNLRSASPPPPDYTRTKDNYILTTLERQAINNKAQQLAAYGVVPYDTLENFFYILAATENESDLYYIANVVGIPELGQPRYIRNIRGVCEIADIYKIGYLSQGVASVNQRYARQYSQVQLYTDPGQSYYGGINSSLNLSSELGVLGPLILSTATSLTGSGSSLRSAPSLSSAAISTAVNVAGSLFGGNSYSPVGGFGVGGIGGVGGFSGIGAAGGTLPPTTISALLNPQATIASQIGTGIGDALSSIIGSTPLGGALAQFGPLGGIAASALLGQAGGFSVGSFMSEVLTGTRIKSSQLANNPMLQPPSYAGKSFFGEAPVAMPAIDQVFCRSIGAFGSSMGGSGVVSFGMQNFASMGSSMSVSSLVSQMITGSFSPPPLNTYYGAMIDQNITNVCSVLNVQALSNIEPRRSDNAIPFMIGFGAAILGETFNPFGSSPFTDGWKLAASTANDIQRYNPQYLETVRTSL